MTELRFVWSPKRNSSLIVSRLKAGLRTYTN